MTHSHKPVLLSVGLVITILATLGLASCGGTPATKTTSNPPITSTTAPPTTTTVPPTTTSNAGAAFYSTNCTVCHGANRQGVTLGTSVLGPPILVTSPTITKYTTDAALAAYIVTHQTGTKLAPGQALQLAQFLRTP